MAQPQRTQKSIAERFKGNLDYYKKAHYLRRAKFLVTLGVVVVGLAAMAVWHFFGSEKFYSSGSITRSHAQFASDCSKCHVGASTVAKFSIAQLFYLLEFRHELPVGGRL